MAVVANLGWVFSVEPVPQSMARGMLSISTDPMMLLLGGILLDGTTAMQVLSPLP